MKVNGTHVFNYWRQLATCNLQPATSIFLLTAVFILFLAGCGTEQQVAADTAVPASSSGGGSTIVIDGTAEGTAVDPRIFGTNAPAWLNPSRLENQTFINRTKAAGITLIRLPGGSWSNSYNWLDCEWPSQNIDPNAECYWPWAARPSDFIDFLQATDTEGMYTVNINGTSKDAAALVAFFNGDVNDDRDIGVDVRGVDWGTVSDWAQLRADNGNPNPINIKYFEVGNEIYGANQSHGGSDCASWGWEDVWTCDGSEYVNGIGSGANRREGFKEFQAMMQWVDPTIQVGAVGVGFMEGWTDEFGEEVIAEAGDIMEFYIIHHYAYNDPPPNISNALAVPHNTWAAMRENVEDVIAEHSPGSCPELTVTEYNMFAFDSGDSGQWMTRNVNMLFMADTIGQLIANGFDIATQWDLANGTASNGTDYGLMNADTYARAPQYYAYPLWAKFGDTMLPLTNPFSAANQLSVYAGRVDADTISVLAINKTNSSIDANIQINGFSGISGGTADIAQGSTLTTQTVTYNGSSNPNDSLSNAPSTPIGASANPLAYTFPSYSVTVLLLNMSEESSALPLGTELDEFAYLPLIAKIIPTPTSTATPTTAPTVTTVPQPTPTNPIPPTLTPTGEPNPGTC